MFWLAQVLGACSHKCCCRGHSSASAGNISWGYQPAQQRLAWELLVYPQQANRSCLFKPDHKIYACGGGAKYAFPLSLVKPFPTISINETKLKHSLFCAACFLLFPTQLNFLSQTGICLLYNSRERRQGHTVRAFCWRSRRSSRVRSGLGISFQPRCRILPPTRCEHGVKGLSLAGGQPVPGFCTLTAERQFE